MKIQFHRNLNGKPEKQNIWSVIYPKQPTTHCLQAVLYNVKVKHPTATSKQFLKCFNGGSRKVFAWFKAERVDMGRKDIQRAYPLSKFEQIYFNPTKQDTHFHVRRKGKKIPVDHMVVCIAREDGSMWGIVD